MNFNLEMEKRQEKITGILEYYLPKEEGFQKTVLEAMNFSMRAGGKRLRPVSMICCAAAPSAGEGPWKGADRGILYAADAKWGAGTLFEGEACD